MDRGAWWATVHGVTKRRTGMDTHTHTHTQECYSAIKKTRAMTFAWMSWIELEITWIEREIIRLSELSYTEKDKYNMISLAHGIFFKKYK